MVIPNILVFFVCGIAVRGVKGVVTKIDLTLGKTNVINDSIVPRENIRFNKAICEDIASQRLFQIPL